MQRFVGAIEARTSMLEKRMDVVERDLKAQLEAIQVAISSANGGRKALAWAFALLCSLTTALLALHQMGVHF